MVYERYGPLEVLEVREVDPPALGARDLLIKVEAASVNRSDWEGLIGKPLYARMRGLRRPQQLILGSDVAGHVVEVGSGLQVSRGAASGQRDAVHIPSRLPGWSLTRPHVG